MREYKQELFGDGEEIVIELEDGQTAEQLRKEYYYHFDDSCYFAKKVDGQILFSRDDLFSSEREDATHLVILLK